MASDEELLKRLDKLEAGKQDLNGLVGNLRDGLIVTSEIQRRQSEVQKSQAESIDHLYKAVDELTGKLNGLIGYLDNLPRNPPQES